MEKTKITRCPKCDTTFKVTPTQLSVAKGAVRCGACLHVFRASDYFQGAKEDSSPQDDRTQDMFSESLFETPAEQSAITPQENELSIDSNDAGLIHDDMGSDDGLIHDDMHDDDEPKRVVVDISQDFLSIDTDETLDPFFSDSEKPVDSVKEDAGDDESWTQALLNDSEDEEVTQAAQKKSAPKPLPKINQPSFSYIEVDPLDLSLPEKRSKSKLWLGIVSCAVLLATLLAQLAYFNYDQWARQESMRPWYQLACDQLACTLPSTYDLSKIRTTTSPRVSSHSKYQDALSVDVLFMNHANFEQAFPRLELTFTDNNEKTIAHRLFTPNEYLAGEAAGLSLMPIQTPIHIALEIRDPGARANNYKVRFLAP
mgnify:FL=1